MKKTKQNRIDELKQYFIRARKAQDLYWKRINEIEQDMKDKFNVDYELFHCDGSLAGIGDYNREYELIPTEQLE